ncbi:hypothetical protein [Aeromicrobium sp. 179-A 4D2 NHS]|uniref:hypothetical protein n=1 Tax=Aeromicrobium sp. 179-A 4D2 NHS TaxID=3142375 RepID=UPI0039A226C5
MSALGPNFPTTREDAAEGRINGILGTYYRAVEDLRAWTPGGSKFVCDISEVDSWEPFTSPTPATAGAPVEPEPVVAPDSESVGPDLVDAVQWVGVPGPVVHLLADEDGKTYGYGYGDGASMVFSYAHGQVIVNYDQWVALWSDGTVTVHDTEPLG